MTAPLVAVSGRVDRVSFPGLTRFFKGDGMPLDLVIAISASAFVAGLFIGVLRGWNACNQKWFDAERRGEQIEGYEDEFGDTPAYRVRRVDMMPIDFVPAKKCGACNEETD